ncbi:MAG: family 10 glycosylhydrolase [Xenococcaceae cyanobacterium MO_188.B19]|nr:family 10 glycosylhydrolase [Xenococcaceae cyanobacterium MO_188.B19]
MSKNKKEPQGCGCANIPISVILLAIGGGYWWFSQQGNLYLTKIGDFVTDNLPVDIPGLKSTYTNPPITPTPTLPSAPIAKPNSQEVSPPEITSQTTSNPKPKTVPKPKASTLPKTTASKPTLWEKKAIRGIYLSRYQVTNNASEQMIRERVRYYHSQGINTIIHGVWGNACTMYNSQVMEKTLGYKSCPNLFRDRWLEWLIDEAHKHDMEVHAYFEKGIKIDKNSPVFDLAVERKWIVPGVDRTYAGVDHYILDVEVPEVANFFRDILVEFVQKYPTIDAVQWDDYLGYHAELPGKVDRTDKLTKFTKQMIDAMKQANPKVSFDLCHHNPYWAKRYFAADWEKWGVDRVFIQAYNEKNFQPEVNYAQKYAGIAITDQQLHRLPEIIANDKIKGILVFPLSGNPEATASKLNLKAF